MLFKLRRRAVAKSPCAAFGGRERGGSEDSHEEVQRVLVSKVFPRQAEVVTTEEWSATSKL